jgi:hypothetical protein
MTTFFDQQLPINVPSDQLKQPVDDNKATTMAGFVQQHESMTTASTGGPISEDENVSMVKGDKTTTAATTYEDPQHDNLLSKDLSSMLLLLL